SSPQLERIGQRLGNYQLIRLLGEGGFAEVYLGEHLHLKTQAAVKLLHTRLSIDDIEGFRRLHISNFRFSLVARRFAHRNKRVQKKRSGGEREIKPPTDSVTSVAARNTPVWAYTPHQKSGDN